MWPRADQVRPLQRVVQLADVARPIVPLEELQGLGLDLAGARPPAIAGQQVLGQQRHVFQPLAQRRDVDPQHVEPVVEVLAEGALGDLFQQVPLGRGDDPHVGLDGRGAADALEDLLLDGPQQLRLLLQGDVVDVVEVERSAFGQVEAALAAADRRR